MEHNTAAVCGTWWRADINVDGTPRGYGVYEVDGNQVKWLYKSAGYPKEHQLHVYQAGSSDEYPSDIIANVWNWDEQWKVEWYETESEWEKCNATKDMILQPKQSVLTKKR